MLNDLPAGQQVYLVTGYTDLRRSIDRLAMIVQGQLHLDPFSTVLFLFCGRRRDRSWEWLALTLRLLSKPNNIHPGKMIDKAVFLCYNRFRQYSMRGMLCVCF